MNNIPISIDRRILWRFVNKKINRVVHHFHVLSVINILFDEILKDLKDDKELKIHNLGTIQLKNMPPRRYHDVTLHKIMEAKGRKVLRFFLTESIRKKLTSSIDIDKTFKDD